MQAAVTGWALVTPIGDSPEAVVARLLAGERAAAANPHFPSDAYGCPAVAAIRDAPPRTPHDRVLRRMGRFGWAVGRAALALAGPEAHRVIPRDPVTRSGGDRSGGEAGERLGLYSAVGGLRAHWNELLPALRDQADDLAGSWARGLRLLHPFWMLQHLSNNAHALLSRDVGARGEGATFGGASAGAQALEAAILALADGAVDAALVVAHDTLIEPETLVDLVARGGAGLVPGEAAAALVLERPDRRSALAWIAAASAADGETGAPAAATLGALARRLARDDRVVDGDGERAALADVVPGAQLTAVQAATGQLGAAAPLVQAIALAGCLERGRVPPIAGFTALPTAARSALCLSGGSPGLAGAVRISLEPMMEEMP